MSNPSGGAGSPCRTNPFRGSDQVEAHRHGREVGVGNDFTDAGLCQHQQFVCISHAYLLTQSATSSRDSPTHVNGRATTA